MRCKIHIMLTEQAGTRFGRRRCWHSAARPRRFAAELELRRESAGAAGASRAEHAAIVPATGVDGTVGLRQEIAFAGIVPDAMLGGRHPGAAKFQNIGRVREGSGECAATGATASLKHHRSQSRPLQDGGGGSTGETGSNHQGVEGLLRHQAPGLLAIHRLHGHQGGIAAQMRSYRRTIPFPLRSGEDNGGRPPSARCRTSLRRRTAAIRPPRRSGCGSHTYYPP